MYSRLRLLLVLVLVIVCSSVIYACKMEEDTAYPIDSYGFPMSDDPDGVYYSSLRADVSSKEYSDTIQSKVISYRDGLCLFVKRLGDNNTSLGYDMHIIDPDGTEEKVVDLDTKDAAAFCNINNEFIVTVSSVEGIRKYDFNGDRIYTTEFDIFYISSLYGAVPCSQGFVIIGDCGILVFDADCNEIGRARSVSTRYTPVNDMSCFEQNGCLYLVATPDDGRDGDCIAKADIENETIVTEAYVPELIGGEGVPTYYYGPYIKTDESDYIYSVDAVNKRLVPLVRLSNMVVIPEQMNHFLYPDIHLLDNGLITYYYSYSFNLPPDLIVIYPDNESNYKDRIEIKVKGYGATRDAGLINAAYKYNTSQQTYFVRVLEYERDYQYIDETDAQQVQLRLMQEFMSPDAPDIYYGDSFDYDYWGHRGIVIDMAIMTNCLPAFLI